MINLFEMFDSFLCFIFPKPKRQFTAEELSIVRRLIQQADDIVAAKRNPR